MNDGLRPFRTDPYSVNWLTQRTSPPTAPRSRFIFPSSSSNTRSPMSFARERFGQCLVIGVWVTPSSTSKPVSIAPTDSPSTRTLARLTRWTRARTDR